MQDGIIEVGSEQANALGFTPDLFDGWLWKTGDRIMVSMVMSKQEGRGNLSKLFDNIEASGHKVAVPTPLGKMGVILQRKGFVPHVEHDHDMGAVEVWMRPNAAGKAPAR